jgi:hypothetical protein
MLTDKHMLKEFVSGLLRKVSKSDEVTGGLKNLLNNYLHDLWSPAKDICVYK